MLDPIHQFRDALAHRQIIPPDHVIADGQLHRCDADDKHGRNDAAYVLHLDGMPAGGFENHRDGLGWQDWRAEIGRTLSPDELAKQSARIADARQKRQAEREKLHRAAQIRAGKIWEQAAPCTAHPYLTRKGIDAHGAKVITASKAKQTAQNLSRELAGDLLVIPMRDTDGTLHSLQFITGGGIKRPMTGGRKRACHYLIGEPGKTICIAEGFATGASILQATGHAVAVAFDAGNLESVALAVRMQHPGALLILCADDDYATPDNPGVTLASKAARAAGGIVAVPDFGETRPEGATDFNDLHQARGLETVKCIIDAAMVKIEQEPDCAGIEHELDDVATTAQESPEVPTESTTATATATAKAESAKRAHDSGRFEVTTRGVEFHEKDKDGNNKTTLICSPLHILAKTRDKDSNAWGRLLHWQDDDGKAHQWAMPAKMLQGDGQDLRSILADQGLSIAPGKRARDLLASYLQTWKVGGRARCVDRLGWHGGVYLTPSETIGGTTETVVFQNAHAIEPAFSTAGTGDEWREHVAARAVDNSRLAFAVSVALAAPLARLIGEDSGGFHLRGASSSGKSTILKVAASVWGNPEQYCRLWRATVNGLEGLAALHNDGLLILDELSQIDPRQAGEAAYLLANGQGKTRANRTGASRNAASWNLLFLSAGELSLTTLMAQEGKRTNAGQEIRLADIEADAGAGMGVFETLHDCPNPVSLALELKDAASRYYGAAGIEWLRYLVAHRDECVQDAHEHIHAFMGGTCPDNASGQVLRVARRFALVGAAGELATDCGITGWHCGDAMQATENCFAAWLAGFGGTGNLEVRALLEQVRAFFEAHGASRFDAIDSDKDAKVINRTGFYRYTINNEREYLVFPEAFKREVCKGFDSTFAARALIDAGFLTPGDGARPNKTERIPGLGVRRCYIFNSNVFA